MRKRPLLCLLWVPILILSACTRSICAQGGSAVPSQKPVIPMYDDTRLPVQEDAAENAGNTEQPTPGVNADSEEPVKQEETLVLRVNGNELNVSWENNSAVDELIAYVREESIIVEATRYGGFEQVGSLPQYFFRKDAQITTQPGDIVLYSGNQLVIFFGSNTWSYTMLGHIEGLSEQELSALLGADSVTVEIQ